MAEPEGFVPTDSGPLQSQCPKCGGPMEAGFLFYDYHRVSWMHSRPAHFWQVDGSDHLGPKSSHGMLYAAGTRCRACGIVTFQYLPG